MSTRNTLSLILIALVGSACSTMGATEMTGAVVTGTGALVAFVQAMSPMLEPEQAAKLSAIAASVEGTTEALSAALGQVAETIGQLKADVVSAQASEWTAGEKAGLGSGVLAGGVALSRALSHFKHKPARQVAAGQQIAE